MADSTFDTDNHLAIYIMGKNCNDIAKRHVKDCKSLLIKRANVTCHATNRSLKSLYSSYQELYNRIVWDKLLNS